MRTLLSATALLLASAIIKTEAQDFPAPATPLYGRDTLTILVMGDMMMHSKQIESAHIGDDTYDFSSYFHLIQDRISSADIAIANMEFTLAGKPYTGYPSFSAPDSFGLYLAECGFDIFLSANNHIFDKGGKGAERTLEMFRRLEDSHGIKICGLAENELARKASMPLKVVKKGMRLGMINFTYGTNLGSDRHWPKTNYMNDKDLINDALIECRDCDLALVLPHWGNEYELTHSEAQEKTALILAENGADVIIGSHPHVPQDMQYISDRNVPVAYSVGNAVSNMSAPDTQVGLMAEVRLVREENGDTKVLPLEFTYLWCSRPGGFSSSYTVLPVSEYIGKRHLWKGAWDYDKMLKSYERVKNITGIEDN